MGRNEFRQGGRIKYGLPAKEAQSNKFPSRKARQEASKCNALWAPALANKHSYAPFPFLLHANTIVRRTMRWLCLSECPRTHFLPGTRRASRQQQQKSEASCLRKFQRFSTRRELRRFRKRAFMRLDMRFLRSTQFSFLKSH